jgi:hypothetical protein
MTSSGRWKLLGDRRALALALPFLFGALSLRFAIAPLGDAIASAAARAVPEPQRPAASASPDIPALPPAPLPPFPPAVELGGAGGEEPALPRRIASRAPAPRRETIDEARDAGTEGGRAASVSDAPKSTIVVPAAVVTRALERRDVSATNASAPDGAPLGARLAGVGKYKTGLRDGDVVVTVGGTRTPTVNAMVNAAMAVATSGATRISGRILRGDTIIAVVLELPKQ